MNIDTRKESKSVKKIDLKTSASYNEPGNDHHCSSSYFDGAITLRPQAFKQKLLIATNILIECKEDMSKQSEKGQNDTKSDDSLVEKLHKYTNLPTEELIDINNSITLRDRTFRKVFNDIRMIVYPTWGLLANDIRSLFVDFLIVNNSFPSKIDLLNYLKRVMLKYSNEKMSLQKLVRNKLIKYRYFPEMKKYLLTEHPERVYERIVYLTNMKELRSQERDFVYVGIKRFVSKFKNGLIVGLAAIPSRGIIEKFFAQDSENLVTKKWLRLRVLPLVKENDVIVLTQPKIDSELTPHDRKCKLAKWLDDHNIPFDIDSNTADLYYLCKTFKKKFPEDDFSDVFKNAGTTVTASSYDCGKLNFFYYIWSGIDVMDPYHTEKTDKIRQTVLKNLEQMENLSKIEDALIEEECKILEEDKLMEKIIENVLEMTKKGEVHVVDFPKECSGSKADYFETYVSDFVMTY